MLRSIIRRFKSTNNLSKKPSDHYVVLCPKCYFVTSSEVSVAEYIEMHKNFNTKFADRCPNDFIVINSKSWNNHENCSALFYPVY
ncbi:Ac56-like protein [Bombyx mandarina nucleopolyhedrovirus]|uniref:AC56 n=2 Tax=Bombyx mori nuclear polyhedrosis virus TaxID=271108 RepID=O92422_NPVBM|nr:AcMNPV orf56 [Bombyx mori nucleopolyhedrovirus]ACQ57237.1 Ac56-like protein [Bombyx mandarina nucleopolyhedrovirus]AFO10017.1 hypothetical protein Bomanpvs2gp047 [Bombyx mandarina nucleopolyhedrovirus S2]AAC63730.1 AcMNPV orf56 [Bombyx mori nucleopolyhedrovirus]AFN08974.1 hypothetical protein Bmnpvcubicgp047 [Bombyx mori nucleopolyhedrovirus]AFN21020.1 hypothetical protein Bmnpvzhejianggp047 [Bombyx mori nucleopolyhedrovirus]